jgi:hypothetical protein
MGIKDIKKNSQKGDFLTLTDGQKVKLRILNEEPLANYSIFSNDVNQGANLPEDYPLPEPLRARLQHIFVVYNLESKALQILKTSQTTAEKLLATYEAYHDTWDFDFQFSRKGAGFNDTEYFAVVIPTEFDPAVRDNIKMPDLEKVFALSDDAQIARVLPGALKNAIEAKEKRDAEKAAKQAAKDKKAGIPPAPDKAPAKAPAKAVAKAPEPAAPTPAAPETPAAEELSLDEEKPPVEESKFSPVRVIQDLRTDEDKKCPICKGPREVKQGNVKANDPDHNKPWGQVKVAVCAKCNKMKVVEKLPDPVPVAA